MNMLSSDMMPVFDGAIPAVIVTSSADGIPNLTNVSKIWYVDAEHVAVANQLFHKTHRNLTENPYALLKAANPLDLQHWELSVKFVRAEQNGPLVETMRQEIETVAWLAGIASTPAIRSAIVFQVTSVRRCVEESQHLTPAPETYGDLLKVLAQTLDLSRSSYWAAQETGGSLQLLASIGVPGAGTNQQAFVSMQRLAALAQTEKRVIRLRNIRSQMRYVHSIRSEEGKEPLSLMPSGFLAIPVIAFDTLIGIVCSEETEEQAAPFDRLDDRFLTLLSHKLGETLLTVASAAANDREPQFRQVVERAKLEWAKTTDPFHTVLSARERQVAVHVAEGHTNAEIARLLFVSPRTVTTHVERIFQKLEVGSRAALTRYVIEKGLLPGADDAREP
jgi:DNA-binding CsgD family transcriptional regulator/predicted pyridoxine 5'-phosphate oxidase superfamily flavin-nucleotide-binding protein